MLANTTNMRFRKRSRDQTSITVLMYHEVLGDEHEIDSWTVVKRSEFKRQMEYLKENYAVVSLDDAFEIINIKDDIKRKVALVTFDDGYSGNYSVAMPIMAQLNLPFTVFCATGAIEKQQLFWYDKVIRVALHYRGKDKLILHDLNLGIYNIGRAVRRENKWSEIHRLLSDLKKIPRDERERIVKIIVDQLYDAEQPFPLRPLSVEELNEIASNKLTTIGAHTHTHDILVQLASDEAQENIILSQEKLRIWTGKSIDYFSYPNGDHNKDIISIVKNAGFKGAFTTEERKWSVESNVYAIPRIGIGRFDSLNCFKSKITCVY